MSDEVADHNEGVEGSDTAPHDDIMRRLLDYQRHLREGLSPEQASLAVGRGSGDGLVGSGSALATEVRDDEVVLDLASHEIGAPVEEAPRRKRRRGKRADDVVAIPEAVDGPDPRIELEARIDELDGILSEVARIVSETRTQFQEMAVAADERLAEIEWKLEARFSDRDAPD